MSDRMVGADDGIMVSQRGLTTRAGRYAQAKHIALAPLLEDAREHNCIRRATELLSRDSPGTARVRCLLTPHAWMNDTSITSTIPTSTHQREREREKRWFVD